MLCQECEKLVLVVLATDLSAIEELQKCGTTLRAILRTADDGCFICYTSTHHAMATTEDLRLLESIRNNKHDDLPVSKTMFAGQTADGFKFLRVLHEALQDDNEGHAYLANCDIILRPRQGEAKSIAGGGEPRQNTGDAAVITMLQSWLTECLKEHKSSVRPSSPHRPSRLIDVMPFGRDMFTVVDTITMTERPSYFTLSHRWGPEIPTLRSDTEARYKTGVKWAELPGVYQDAFKLVKTLGYRYLWIDSLCISQDDQQDMLGEILDMAQIYSNSLCNIVALQARTESLFATRSLGAIDASLKIDRTQGEKLPSEVIFQHRDLWTYEVTRAPLAYRGWVFQEQLLAPRTLYFGKNQVYWECCAGRRSESHPTLSKLIDGSDIEQFSDWFEPLTHCDTTLWAWDAPLGVFFRWANALIAKKAFSKHPAFMNLPPEVAEDIWYMLIIRYSTRRISFPQDRLSAVTGIAKVFARVTNYTWAAGLWEEQMPLNLLWHSEPTEFAANEHNFPSWSWASGTGVIPPFRRDFVGARIVANVVNIECTTIDDDPFSPLSDALLQIRAVPLALAFDSDSGNIGLRLSDSILFPQTVGIDRDTCSVGFRPCNEYENEPHAPTIRAFHKCIELPEASFVALIIYTHAHQQKNGLTALHLGGLLIELAPATEGDDSPATFHRFGMFHGRDWKTPLSQLPWAPELFSLSSETFSEARQTHSLMDFGDTSCLKEFTIL